MTEIERSLYLCRANYGRSQVAAALHNEILPGTADSAGVRVEELPGRYVKDWKGSRNVRQAMSERKIDISDSPRNKISYDKLAGYGHILIMSEIEYVPVYLLGFEGVEWWPVPDLKDLTMKETRQVVGYIDERVKNLASRILANYKPRPGASPGQGQ